ncbi:MAG: helix-hairpin-helix domain-containing protein [Candidatus Thorarchaeota archaeon]
MSRKTIQIALLVCLVATLFLVSNAVTPTYDASMAGKTPSGESLRIVESPTQIAGEQDEASWWNSTFLYRRYYNITEPGISGREFSPVHLYLTFEDDHCYDGSIRVGYYESGSWEMMPLQVWNITYHQGTDFIQSASVSFRVNVTQGATQKNYYIYYADDDVGAVSYPDFYPFTYTTYTYSLINLVSYYDSNNYTVDMWDDTAETWANPTDVDAYWEDNKITPNNVSHGMLEKYGRVRYEPTADTDTYFWGFYRIQSNYPLAVSVGRGDVGIGNSAMNDWFSGMDELGQGLGTHFVIGGVEGFPNDDEGRYWVQAHHNDTEVSILTSSGSADSGWYFHDNSEVTSWPAVLDEGEYIAKGNVHYSTDMVVNSSTPVSVRCGDHDATYGPRDIMGFYPSVDNRLAGEEFYTIDMGDSSYGTKVVNVGDASSTIDVWRRAGSSSWTQIKNEYVLNPNASFEIGPGSSSSTDPEDILHIKASSGSNLTVRGMYKPDDLSDHGDWCPTVGGYRFGTHFKLEGLQRMKFFIQATEAAEVNITGYNDASYEIPAGGVAFFMPQSSSYTLYHIESNATISIAKAARFDTTSPYKPYMDQGYGWAVPCYAPEGDENGLQIEYGEEIKLFEFDITIKDLDGLPIEGVTVTLHNSTTGDVWTDDNGLNRTGTTDSNGLVVFEGLNNATYEVLSEIDAASWLTTSYDHVWIRNTSDHSITSTVTRVNITLDVASFDIYLHDLMDDPMSDNPDEDTNLRLNNGSSNPDDYIDQGQTNSTGWVNFYRIPQHDYTVYARYAGSLGWSYTYTDLEKFASWSITADEFNGGGFTHEWTLPLTTLHLDVISWDDQAVDNAKIVIDNQDEPGYSITKWTHSTGQYTFTRIVNGTWSIEVSKDDNYDDTPTALNDTESATDLQGYIAKTIELPISRMNIKVTTTDGWTHPVVNADVNVTLVNGTPSLNPIARGKTNDTGWVVFYYIHGNISTPYPNPVSYNLSVVSGEQSETLEGAQCDYNWTAYNWVQIDTPTYSNEYSELNATHYIVNIQWGQNFTDLVVGWYDKDGEGTTSEIADPTWLNITIKYEGITFFEDTWNGSGTWITRAGSINYSVVVNASAWGLDVIEGQYEMIVTAHSDAGDQDDPAPMTIYVDVAAASTSGESGSGTLITGNYTDHNSHMFWLHDDTNGKNVSGLDTFSWKVKSGSQEVLTGDLSSNGDGTYSILASNLNQLGSGYYSLTVTLEKRNYVNHTLLIDLEVYDLPMWVSVDSYPDYSWGPFSHNISFYYRVLSDNSTPDLSDISVNIEWIDSTTGDSYLNVSKILDTESSGAINYTFTGDLVPVGSWDVVITCQKANYTLATSSPASFEVSAAPSTASAVDSGPILADWASEAVFQVDYIRTADAQGLEGADISHNWNGTFDVDYDENGRYILTVGTTEESGSYTIDLTVSRANHMADSVSLSLEIRVPLTIKTEYGSTESPLEVYWTRTFDTEIRVLDNSRFNTTITDATASYHWEYGFIVDQTGDLPHVSGGTYRTTLDAQDALPIDDLYTIEITAERPGSMNTSRTIYLRILEVPNEIVLKQDYFDRYYGDTLNISFYWNNTLDNIPISSPNSAWIEIWGRSTNITTGVNYGNGTYSFEVDTKLLEMYPESGFKLYTFKIEMSAAGYAEYEPPSLAVLVQETPTRMDVGDLPAVEWGEPLTIRANLTDTIHGAFVWEDAVVELVYGDRRKTMEPYHNGTFYVTIETENYFSARDQPYDLSIEYTLPNYVDGHVELQITVNPKTADIKMGTVELRNNTFEGTWSDEVGIAFTVPDIEEQANATYYWLGFEEVNGLFNYDSYYSEYTGTIDTSKVPAGVRTLRIAVFKDNYTISPFDIVMTLNPLEAEISTATTSLLKIHTVETTAELSFTLTYDEKILDAATIQFDWGGIQRTASFVEGEYVFEFNPSVEDIEVPKTYLLNFTTQIQNYSVDTVSVPLTMLAPTELTGPAVYLEEDQSATAYFRYWDTYNNRPVEDDPDANLSVGVYFPGSDSSTDVEFNGTHYYLSFEADELGEAQTDPYEIRLTATATGYQNYTATSEDEAITVNVYVSPPTYNIPLVGRIQRSLVNLVLIMFGLFILIVGGAVGVQRWRRPHAIKQIESAISDMEENKTAKVKDIKSMGMVVSDLLAPGLAELDMKAPTIDTGPEVEFEEGLGEEAEDLLGELDALDEISKEEPAAVEESTDYEAQLEAELEAMDEEEIQVSDIPGIGPTIEDRLANAGYTTVSALSEADPLVLAEVEGISENKAEQIVDEARAMVSENVEKDIKPEAEDEEPPPEEDVEETLPENEADAALPEENMEDELPEGESEDVLSEESELSDDKATAEEAEPEIEKPKTKRELIEQLPDEIKETMGDDEIRKLSKRELEALIEGQEGSEE